MDRGAWQATVHGVTKSCLPGNCPLSYTTEDLVLHSTVTCPTEPWCLSFPGVLGLRDKHSLSGCSVEFSSVAQSCPTLCDPVDCSMPGLPVHHQLPELTQTHVH